MIKREGYRYVALGWALFTLFFAGLTFAWAGQKFQPEEATIRDIHVAMKSGELTSRQLVVMYSKRIEAYDQRGPSLKSVILLNPNAMATADELDAKFKRSGFTGPLHGIPVVLKDNVDTADLPTTGGSLSLKGSVPPDDAFIVKRLKEAGAIILAKVNLHEFAAAGFTRSSMLGQTLNPYDLSRSPGGSSGGTGAAVAANFGAVGIGTDTVNSIRSPASANCLVGIKPTMGLVSRDGIIPLALTQDMAGPITRTVEDAVVILDIVAGYDPADPVTAWSVRRIANYRAFLDSRGLQGARLGILKSFFGKAPHHQEVNAVINKAIIDLRKLGGVIIDIEEPIDADKLASEVSVHYHEFKVQVKHYLDSLGPKAPVKSLEDIMASGKHDPGLAGTFQEAIKLSQNVADYKDRLLKRLDVQQLVMKIMADYKLDALVFPHQKRLVAPVGEGQPDRNGVLGAVTGFPAIVVPAGFSSATAVAPIGVPVGIEFLGRPWSEPTLIKMGYAFEQGTKYRRPPLSVPPLKP